MSTNAVDGEVAALTSSGLRILQVIETGGPGGAETVFVELSTELQQRGNTVHALVGGEGWLASTLRERTVKTDVHRSEGALDVTLIRTLVRIIRAEGIQVIHAHLFGGAVYAGIAGAICRIPVVVTLHGHADVKDSGIRLLLKRWVLRWTAARVVTVSEVLLRDLDASLQLPARTYVTIPNGVRQVTGDRHVAAYAEPSRPPTLIAVGNIRQPKGYPVLVDAVAILRASHPDITLRIAGQPDGGNLASELRAQIERLGLNENIELLGFVADPKPLLRDADCFVLASYREGFSIATIEAMLAGIPVVATRSGGPEEIITHGLTGILVPPGDAPALAAGIAGVLKSPSESRAMAQRGFDFANQRYSLSAMIDAYEAVYSTVTAAQ